MLTYISTQLKKQRHAKKLSKKDLTKQIPRYNLLESGLVLPNLIELKQLAKLFEKPINTNGPKN